MHDGGEGIELKNDEQNGSEDEEDNSLSEEEEDYGMDDEEEGYGSGDDETLEANYDELAEFDWLEPIDGKIMLTNTTDSSMTKIGHSYGELIRRSQVQQAFYEELEEPTSETSELAFDLFDRYGRLRKEFKTHEVKKGSGLWGDELDTGDLLHLEQIVVEKPYRRQGLGRKLVKAMIEKTRPKCGNFFAIVLVSNLISAVEKETPGMTKEERIPVYDQHEETAIHFFRSLGFRRVGSTSWFALAGNKNHSCHNLLALDDYDPPKPPKRAMLSQVEAVLKNAKPKRVGNGLAIFEEHGSLMSMDEEDWDKDVKPLFQDIALDHGLWGALDYEGNTILHVAAMRSSPQSIDWILSQNPHLSNTRNYLGETPLDALERHLESQRTKSVIGFKTNHVSDQFTGFSDSSVLTIIKLKSLSSPSQADVSRLKYGCTCGHCTAGVLSPRMRLALLCQAEVQYDMLNDMLPGMSREDWDLDFLIGDEFKFLDPHVRENLKTNKSMRQGFVNLCGHFATCLKTEGLQGVPIPDNVLRQLQRASEWPPCSKNFMDRGGTIFSVGSMIFNAAKDQDIFAGDGEHLHVFKKDIEALPECRNDHEFGFVSGICGYKRIGGVRYVNVSTGQPAVPDWLPG
jgi:GNAT superfamily N-acetyltransferase